MKPNKTPTELEQLITRIHRLIEPSGAVVTWNETLRDPDTGRPRQIDGMIERGGKRIHIECRDRGNVQDVMWVEELIGRRASLQADGIIAVSRSGFTKPATDKAAAFGIIIRTLSEMTDAEIQAWGKMATLNINYIQIEKLELVVIIDVNQIALVSPEPVLAIPTTQISPVFLILEQLANQTEGKFFSDRNTTVTAKIELAGLTVDGAQVLGTNVQLRSRLRREKVDVIGVWNYRGVEPVAPIEAVVTKHGSGGTEIIQRGDAAAMILDLSSVEPPKNCFLYTFDVDFGRTVKAQIAPIAVPRRISFSIDTVLDVKAVVGGRYTA